jgi:hypothetical protein
MAQITLKEVQLTQLANCQMLAKRQKILHWLKVIHPGLVCPILKEKNL